MEGARPTQKDIAAKAGVTQALVSLALSNHPDVAPETRARIISIAEEMGYQPDPYLAGLSAYRKRLHTPNFQATLAWLSAYPEGTSWKDTGTFASYYEGACERAIQLGYKLEEHSLTTKGMTPNRMEEILKARNISGILLPPQPHSSTRMNFCFDHFSAVTIGYTLAEPRLHMVTHHHFRNMTMLFRQLMARGYKRIGFAVDAERDLRTEEMWSAAFLSEQRKLPANQRIPALLGPNMDATTFMKWYRKHQPDVVVAVVFWAYEWMIEAGVKVPEETGFALLSVPSPDQIYAGLWENPKMVGARSVEFLIDMIHRNETGVPDVSLYILVNGSWVEGKTLRPQLPSAS